MNMIKVLRRRFQKCLEAFTMLLFQGSSELEHFRHLNDYVFGVRRFGNAKSMRVIFLVNCLKFKLRFKNAAKNSENFFFSEIIASELVSLNCLY